MNDTQDDAQRLDRWLWFARFFRARSQATAAVNAGHVRINGDGAKPGTRVSPGDRLSIVRDRVRYEIVIRSLAQRRGPAAAARSMYTEDEASVRRREDALERIRLDRLQMPRSDGRPDKRTRRKLRQFNRQPGND